MTIYVYNKTANVINVAISTWDDSIDAHGYNIAPNGHDHWSRTDHAGCLMAVMKQDGSAKTYALTGGGTANIYDNRVEYSGFGHWIELK